MGSLYTPAMRRLMQELGRLPGIGAKSAERLTLHVLSMDADRVRSLAESLSEVKSRVGACSDCYNHAEGALCPVCADPQRDRTLLCVVEHARDVVAIEKTGSFKGVYHVLQGALSPLDNVGPGQIRLRELLVRVRAGAIREVVVATDADMQGDATGMYISSMLQSTAVRVTRIAHGLPVGTDIEFADMATISKALAGRTVLEGTRSAPARAGDSERGACES